MGDKSAKPLYDKIRQMEYYHLLQSSFICVTGIIKSQVEIHYFPA
jgi:hypothetical protein